MQELSAYRTLVFDCDGVILDSNSIKTEAFRSAALPYGAPAADQLVAYHVTRGGVSRYRKFAYFLEEIAPKVAPGMVPGRDGPDLEGLLARYAKAVQEGLRSCAVTPRLADLRALTAAACWMIVSGGDQAELRSVFAERELDGLFDGGIFGSPDTKDRILAREQAEGRILAPALFLGDSQYDHEAAHTAGLDFVFVSSWSEFAGWRDYCSAHGIHHLPGVADVATDVALRAAGMREAWSRTP